MHRLADPAYTVPSPGPAGPPGTIAWLRATVSRFAAGETHARRRALVEARLRELDPAALRAEAHEAARRGDQPPAYLPVAVLAAATGVAARDVAAAVAAVRVVAAAYHPGTRANGADEALGRLIDLLPPGEPEAVAQHVALLVQACEATAALVRGGLERPLDEVLPVPATRRLDPTGNLVAIPLDGRPFGAGPRTCPGREHALALAAGVVEGVR